MEITIFKEVTTESVIKDFEDEAKKYDGLYVDMDNKDERKYVKDKALAINDLLKKVDRTRIDAAKIYKAKVESEAKSIRERLEEANKPFTLLIDEHKEKRAKILAEEKRIADLKAAFEQKQADHEYALLLNEKYDRDLADQIALEEKLEIERQEEIERQKQIAVEQARAQAIEDEQRRQREEVERIEREKQQAIDCQLRAEREAKEAAERAEIEKQQAVEQEKQRQLAEQARIKAEEDAREADKAHRASINNAALQCFVSGGLTEKQAKLAVTLIASKQIDNVKISY